MRMYSRRAPQILKKSLAAAATGKVRVSYYAIAVQCLDLAVGADIPAVLSNWNELLYTLHHVKQDNQVRALHDLVVCNCSVHAYIQQKYTVIRPTNHR